MDVNSLNPAPAGEQHRQHASSAKNTSWQHHFLVKVVIKLVILVIIVGGVWMLWQHQATSGEAKVNKSEYQAVFLTNGQVYFGKLSAVNKSYLDLKDIYYLQVQTAQPSSAAAGSSSTSSSVNPNASGQVQLVKLGNELHGPEDEMSISHTQVLFWENLKSSGKVAQAINKYQSK